MARIVFSSAAFWGDVTPYVPIANELVGRGHDVVFSLPAAHHPALADERFALHDNRSTFTQHDVLADPDQLRMIDRQKGSTTGTALVRYWARRYIADEADQWVDATAVALEDADLLVTHPTAATLSAIPAEARGIPWVCGQLFPSMIPSAHTDPVGMNLSRLPGPVARATRRFLWRTAPIVASRIMRDKEVNGARSRYGLPPRRANMLLAWMDADRTVVLSSRHYSPRQSDWPEGVDPVGFTVWPGPSGAVLDPAIDAFLSAGEAPVLVTLGTSTATIGGPILRDVDEALTRLGLRGLYLGVPEQHRDTLERSDGVFAFAPLGQVLPRCRAVIHQGGHGTVAATLDAGLPAVAIPMGFDQLVHGRRIRELGIGTYVDHTRHRVDDLVRALNAIDDEAHRTRARELGALIHAEEGARKAADVIEDSLRPRAT